MNQVTGRLRSWASDIDPGTLTQAAKTSRLPIVAGPVALMPDAHVGLGSTVGSVIPTKEAIIPAAVGVDIGCGMIAVETTLSASDLPDNLEPFLCTVERVVPAGVGQGHASDTDAARAWFAANPPPRDLGDLTVRAVKQFGTLGSGNHFFEVCLDERDVVWVVLHSGSRGVGNKLAEKHIRKARGLAKALDLKLEDPDLAYFTEGTEEFGAYLADLMWSQRYAMANRGQMMSAALKAFFAFVGKGEGREPLNCHHNYTARERHTFEDGVEREVWLTRKGAIKAEKGDLGVIPGSMGTKSYIVRGKGNPLSYNSCSHGAGRKMSRTQAKRQFTAQDLATQMEGKTWLSKRASSLVDEIPSSYKDVDQVMADQRDLVEIVHTLRQVLNFKGC